MKYVIILLILLIAIAGCVEPQKEEEITKINIARHGAQVYEFSHNILDTLRDVPINDTETIKNVSDQSSTFNIIFDDLASPEEKARYSVVSYNIIIKLKTFYAYERGIALGEENFNSYYHSDGTWFYNEQEILDANDENIIDHLNTDQESITIWLMGPDTGVEETSVEIEDRIVYIKGKTGKEIEIAADRFILAVFGFNDVEHFIQTIV
ncbi:hypothetical protein ACFLQN_04270 [Candidatus Aenigmatarchaeota archaeon]